MARVEWTRLSPADTEDLVAYLLCSEHPDARQRRPSRGDRGIDVYRRLSGGLIVWQVKAFNGPLTTSRKRQITESWEAIQKHINEEGLPLLEWHVVRPQNATAEDEAWLSEMVGDTETYVDWIGLANLEALVSKWPRVVDYYVGNDREELLKLLNSVVKGASVMQSIEDGKLQEPGKSIEQYQALGDLLNQKDPHFKYDLHIEQLDSHPGGTQRRPARFITDVIYRPTDGKGQQVRISVIARNAGALDARPITAKVRFRIESGSEMDKQYQDWLKYGTPVTDIPLVNFSINLPGGLDRQSHGKREFISLTSQSPEVATATEEWVAAVLGSDGTLIASSELLMAPPTTGVWGTPGLAMSGRERRGVFTVIYKIDPGVGVSLTFSLASLEGILLADLPEPLRLLAQLCSPNSVTIYPRRRRKEGDQFACGDLQPVSEQADYLRDVALRLEQIAAATDVDIFMPKRGSYDQRLEDRISFIHGVVLDASGVKDWLKEDFGRRPLQVKSEAADLSAPRDGATVVVHGEHILDLAYDDAVYHLGGFSWSCPGKVDRKSSTTFEVFDVYLDPFGEPGIQMRWSPIAPEQETYQFETQLEAAGEFAE